MQTCPSDFQRPNIVERKDIGNVRVVTMNRSDARIALNIALIDDASNQFMADQLIAEQKAGAICGKTGDRKEALAAAVERREPVFKGYKDGTHGL